MQLSVSAILRVPVRLHPDLRLFLLPGGPLLPALLPVLVHGAAGSALEDQEQTDSRQERKLLPGQQLLQSRPPAEWRRVGKDTQERPSVLKQRALLLVFLTSDLCIKTVHWVRGFRRNRLKRRRLRHRCDFDETKSAKAKYCCSGTLFFNH